MRACNIVPFFWLIGTWVQASQSELISKLKEWDIHYDETQAEWMVHTFFDSDQKIIDQNLRFFNLCFTSGTDCTSGTIQECICCYWKRRYNTHRMSMIYFSLLAGSGTWANLKQDKNDPPYNMPGKHVWLLVADNTSTDSGGPFDIQARLEFEVPDGVTIEGIVTDDELVLPDNTGTVFDLGLIKAREKLFMMVLLDVQAVGDNQVSVELKQNLFDPNPSNNKLERNIHIIPEGSRVMLPWVSTNEQFRSGILINNLSSEPAYLEFEAVPGGDAPTLTKHSLDAIPPFGSIQIDAYNMFSDQEEEIERSYAVLVRSNAKIEASLVTVSLETELLSPALGNGFDIRDKPEVNSSEILFGYLPTTDGLISAPVIVNTNLTATDINMSYYNQSGTLLLFDNMTLKGLESFVPFATVTNDLIDTQEDVYMVAKSQGTPISGLSFVFNEQREPSIGNVSTVEPVKDLYLPWVSSNQQFESIIIINNLGDSATEVVFRAQRADGDPFHATRTIPAHGFLKTLASDLFPNLGEGPGFGVRVTADKSQILGRWVTNNLTTASGSSPSQGVGIALPGSTVSEPLYSTKLLFTWTPNHENVSGAIVFNNVGTAKTNVSLSMVDSQGNEVATQTFNEVDPFRPKAILTSSLFPSDIETGHVVAVSNGQPLTGVTFVFNPGAEPAIGDAVPLGNSQEVKDAK